MKKTVFAIVAVTAWVPVFAQNSVALYGLIHEGFDYTANVNGSTVLRTPCGYVQGSRQGARALAVRSTMAETSAFSPRA